MNKYYIRLHRTIVVLSAVDDIVEYFCRLIIMLICSKCVVVLHVMIKMDTVYYQAVRLQWKHVSDTKTIKLR